MPDVEVKAVPFRVKLPPMVILPVPPANIPPVKLAFPVIEILPVPPVNTPPVKVEFPPTVILPEPPMIVPAAILTLLTVDTILTPWKIVPVYPALMVKLNTVPGASRVQFPTRTLLKITASASPGTVNPPAPPETLDQLAGLFQLDAIADTQNRLAAETLSERHKNSAEMQRVRTNFMGTMF